MFAYCLNNPVAFQDGGGHSALLTTLGVMAVGGIFGGLVNAISVASNGGSAQDCASAALAGFIGGALGVGTAALMLTNPATAPYANVTGRGVATLLTDLGTSLFMNGEIKKEDVALAAFDVSTDMMFSTMIYYYNPLTDGLSGTISNAAMDGMTDIALNELFSQNSFTNRTAGKNKKSTCGHGSNERAKNYARIKVGRLIGVL